MLGHEESHGPYGDQSVGSVALFMGEPLEPTPDGLLAPGRANFQFACNCIAAWAVESVESVEPKSAQQTNKPCE